MKQQYILSIILFTLAAFSVKSQSLSDSLHAHYNFDGNLLDETINNHDLDLITGSILYNFESSGDSSIYFDGLSSVSTISNFDNSSYTEMSISLWVKSNNITSDLQICLQGAYMGFGAYIQANTGSFVGFFDASSSNAAVSSSPITDNLWHHIVIQNDGNTTYMYIDGALDGSVSDILTVGNGAFNNKLYIGKSNLGTQPFTGYLNDTRIYNRLLKLNEIESLYSGTTHVSLLEPENPENFNVSIYPNPTRQNIVVDLKNKYEMVNIEITDILGKTIYNEVSNNTQHLTFDLNGQVGVYLVKIIIEGKPFTYRIIKE